MEEELEKKENNSEDLQPTIEADTNSIAEEGPIIGSDVPTHPDKVYRSVKGLGAVEDIYDSGVVRSSVTAKETKDLEHSTNSKGKKTIYWTRGVEGKSHMLPKDMYLIEAPYDIAKEQLVKKEDITALYSKLETNEVVNLLENPGELEEQIIQYRLQKLSEKIDIEKSVIESTTTAVNTLRHGTFHLEGEETNIPSITTNKKSLEQFDAQKAMLLQKLSEIVHEKNVAHKHYDQLTSIAEEKIHWINSDEFERRLKLTNATDEEIAQARTMLIENIELGKPIVLPTEYFQEAKDILAELTDKKVLKTANGIHVDKVGTEGVPSYLDRSVILEEKTKPGMPPLPGDTAPSPVTFVESTVANHEIGHLTQDGLLESELYKDVNLQTKKNSPDPEYIGTTFETDTRIRSMFKELSHVFDPEKESFTQDHLDLLRSRGTKSKDIRDLFEHYDDETIIKLANELPAI